MCWTKPWILSLQWTSWHISWLVNRLQNRTSTIVNIGTCGKFGRGNQYFGRVLSWLVLKVNRSVNSSSTWGTSKRPTLKSYKSHLIWVWAIFLDTSFVQWQLSLERFCWEITYHLLEIQGLGFWLSCSNPIVTNTDILDLSPPPPVNEHRSYWPMPCVWFSHVWLWFMWSHL